MGEMINVCDTNMEVREYQGQRVVTFADIDLVHQRPAGTAKRNFNQNKERLVENEDYFYLKSTDIQMDENRTSGISKGDVNNRGTTYLTEMGYLMVVKSLKDDLAWKVQRQLVSSYFQKKEKTFSVEDALRMMELVNNAPADRLDMLQAILEQAGIHTAGRQNHSHTYEDNYGVGDFIQGMEVVGIPTNDVYTAYLDHCAAYGIEPVSKIMFSKIVNQLLGTHTAPKKINRAARRVFRY